MLSTYFHFRKYRLKLRNLYKAKESALEMWERTMEGKGCTSCVAFNNDNVKRYVERLQNCLGCPQKDDVTKWAQLSDELEKRTDDYIENEYAAEVFRYYAVRKPKLIRNSTGEQVTWKEAFGEDFAAVPKDLRQSLVGLVEKEGRYRFK